jgi:hypothetical protein
MSYFGVHSKLPEISAEKDRVGAGISSDLFRPRMRRHIYGEKLSEFDIEETRDLLYTRGPKFGSGADPPREYEFRVKDMSRLWLYVNGKRPKDRTDLNDQFAHESV